MHGARKVPEHPATPPLEDKVLLQHPNVVWSPRSFLISDIETHWAFGPMFHEAEDLLEDLIGRGDDGNDKTATLKVYSPAFSTTLAFWCICILLWILDGQDIEMAAGSIALLNRKWKKFFFLLSTTIYCHATRTFVYRQFWQPNFLWQLEPVSNPLAQAFPLFFCQGPGNAVREKTTLWIRSRKKSIGIDWDQSQSIWIGFWLFELQDWFLFFNPQRSWGLKKINLGLVFLAGPDWFLTQEVGLWF